MSAFWTTWSATVGLLAAIGAQNVFVIESSILKRNAPVVALTYIVSDFFMISCGYLGLSAAIKSNPTFQIWLGWAGIIFLLYYGAMKLKAASRDEHLNEINQAPMTKKESMMKALAFSWLNPHVYVDNFILIPALALQYQGQSRWLAASGSYLGVITWFVGITILATISSKLFQNSKSWKILNLMTAIIMFWVAFKLYKEMI